jgi:hypothetical protein
MKRHTNLRTHAPAAAIAALAALLLSSTPAKAQQECAVTSLADDNSSGTLRALIANTACNPISFSVTGTINLTHPLSLSRPLTITGPGANLLTVSAGPSLPILQTGSTGTVISGLTMANGNWHQGALINAGTLTVSDCVFSQNTGSFSGAVFNLGSLTVKNCTFSHNSSFLGGGILNLGTLTVTSSAFLHNSAEVGGAIVNAPGSTLTVTNSTFVGNSAHEKGGGIADQGVSTVTNSTFWGNSAGAGGAIFVESTDVTLKNTIFAGNTGVNCAGPPEFGGGHLINDGGGNLTTDDTCPGTYTTDAMLGPLAFNGGPTQTIALLPGSPAIDAAVAGNCPATDQRGISRPQGSGCDIGAYEFVPQAGPVFSGFFAPVSNDLTNVVKAGQAVAVRFSLGGDWGLSILASGSPTSKQVACPNSITTIVSEDVAAVTAGNSSLSYDAATQTYTYVWKTEKSWANTCRQFDIGFSVNGSLTQSATFFFKK